MWGAIEGHGAEKGHTLTLDKTAQRPYFRLNKLKTKEVTGFLKVSAELAGNTAPTGGPVLCPLLDAAPQSSLVSPPGLCGFLSQKLVSQMNASPLFFLMFRDTSFLKN